MAAWSRMVQMQVHRMMVHSAAHLPHKAAHDSGFRPHPAAGIVHCIAFTGGGRGWVSALDLHVTCHVNFTDVDCGTCMIAWSPCRYSKLSKEILQC